MQSINYLPAMNLTDGVSFMWERPMTTALILFSFILIFLPTIRGKLSEWKNRGAADGD
tara:strand:+ start:491 stop:664 length:174 start_codon:yes stop_codon:yes gene_type:complete